LATEVLGDELEARPCGDVQEGEEGSGRRRRSSDSRSFGGGRGRERCGRRRASDEELGVVDGRRAPWRNDGAARACGDGTQKTASDDYCLDMARSMATNGEDRGADVGDDGFEWRRR
jgi:hypothetical protein